MTESNKEDADAEQLRALGMPAEGFEPPTNGLQIFERVLAHP
jgi:hypothetical protein